MTYLLVSTSLWPKVNSVKQWSLRYAIDTNYSSFNIWAFSCIFNPLVHKKVNIARKWSRPSSPLNGTNGVITYAHWSPHFRLTGILFTSTISGVSNKAHGMDTDLCIFSASKISINEMIIDFMFNSCLKSQNVWNLQQLPRTNSKSFPF